MFQIDPVRTALTNFFTGGGKTLAVAGTALAVAGTGTAVAAVAASGSAAPAASAHGRVSVGDAIGATAISHKNTSGHAAAPHAAARHHQGKGRQGEPRQGKAGQGRVPVVRHQGRPRTWSQIRDAAAAQTYPRARPHTLPLADRLFTVGTYGPQSFMPITTARMDNATTIVHQALAKHMGLRSAVIAVATAMQESTLENIDYGDRDSLGLFQQRPSCGWGTAAQVTDPTYAADAFLNALREHQQADPGWVTQPLWENAQAVQDSGFPTAYAKWEDQAAQLVQGIARRMF